MDFLVVQLNIQLTPKASFSIPTSFKAGRSAGQALQGEEQPCPRLLRAFSEGSGSPGGDGAVGRARSRAGLGKETPRRRPVRANAVAVDVN